jgi:cyclopropane fatty-acyl-phospholipid synthase-like methyltransferase
VQTLKTLEQLDSKIAECDASGSDARLREIFASFCMAPQVVGIDPFSEEYLTAQMDLYRGIAGKAYDVSNERTKFNIDDIARRPFPYNTNSAEVVGNQLLSIGSLLRRISAPAGARVLEFGPGWGNTTLAMAMAGFNVTAVDIEPDFCSLIKKRAQQNHVEIDVVNGDFMWAESVTEPYDAVVFFECFHHCADHMRLLRALRSALKPDGKIYFGAEPITDAFPVPWGLRLDGESLWAVRKQGWLELGFTEQYFKDALLATGWDVVKHASNDHFSANVWEATKISDLGVRVPADDLRISTPAGVRSGKVIVVDNVSGAYAFHGPYCTLTAGEWIATAKFANGTSLSGQGVVDVCAGAGTKVLASDHVDLKKMSGVQAHVCFRLDQPTRNVEMRFFCESEVTLSLESMEFRRAGIRV